MASISFPIAGILKLNWTVSTHPRLSQRVIAHCRISNWISPKIASCAGLILQRDREGVQFARLHLENRRLSRSFDSMCVDGGGPPALAAVESNDKNGMSANPFELAQHIDSATPLGMIRWRGDQERSVVAPAVPQQKNDQTLEPTERAQ